MENEFDSPFVLTSIDQHAVIMRKNHPHYNEKSDQFGYGDNPIWVLEEK
jgi:hypothetical protein